MSRRHWTVMIATALCALGVASGCGSDDEELPIPPQQGSFSVLTYNVAGLPTGISSSEPEINMPLISPLLNGFDLVVVQEDFSFHEQLIADVTHPHQSVPKPYHVKPVHDGLNRFSQFPFEPVERVEWAACYGDASVGSGDCLAEKGFSVATTTFGERVTFEVYNLHVEAGGNPEDIEARTSDISQLIAHVLSQAEGEVVILAGDTNLHHDDAEDVPLLERITTELGLTDACEYLSCGDDRIDRVYFRDNDVIELVPTSWSIPPEFVREDGADLSDHKPIAVTFDWRTR